jgi:hypothetical protein
MWKARIQDCAPASLGGAQIGVEKWQYEFIMKW